MYSGLNESFKNKTWKRQLLRPTLIEWGVGVSPADTPESYLFRLLTSCQSVQMWDETKGGRQILLLHFEMRLTSMELSLLPSGSPWVPIFFQGPNFLPRSPFSLFQSEECAKRQSIHYLLYVEQLKRWIFRGTSSHWNWHKSEHQIKPHSVKMFFHNFSSLHFKELDRFDQF